MSRSVSGSSKRKDRVAHIRFSPAEFDALEAAASAAGMTISAFVRSLSMEGAGMQPFLGESDRAVLGLLAEGLRAVGGNLNQLARAIHAGKVPVNGNVSGSIRDAHSVATALASELTEMTRRAAAIRRGEGA